MDSWSWLIFVELRLARSKLMLEFFYFINLSRRSLNSACIANIKMKNLPHFSIWSHFHVLIPTTQRTHCNKIQWSHKNKKPGKSRLFQNISSIKRVFRDLINHFKPRIIWINRQNPLRFFFHLGFLWALFGQTFFCQMGINIVDQGLATVVS